MKRLKRLFCLVMLALLCGCEVKSDAPTYQQIDADYSFDVSLSAEDVISAYMHEPSTEADLVGQKREPVKLQKDEAEPLKAFVNELIADLFNWSYTRQNAERLRAGMDMMTPQLRESVQVSGYFDDYLADIARFKVDTKILEADVMPGDYITPILRDDGTEAYRVRANLVITTSAEDNTFYLRHNQMVYGDTLVEVWFYIDPNSEVYHLIGWEAFYHNPDYIFLFYDKFVGIRDISARAQAGDTLRGYCIDGSKTVSAAEAETLTRRIIEFGALLRFSAKDERYIALDPDALFASVIAPKMTDIISRMNAEIRKNAAECETRDLNTPDLRLNAQVALLKDETGKGPYYYTKSFVMARFLGPFENEIGLGGGIRSYEIVLVFDPDDDYKIVYWHLEDREGDEINVDFDADDIGQG